VSRWRVTLTRQAAKDAKRISKAGLRPKVESLLTILADDRRTNPPPFKPLHGELEGAFSRRITLQHRLVYEIIDDLHAVKVIRMWSHYE
jgi:Txe/YoeB family toxin of toxin-antitoxin system